MNRFNQLNATILNTAQAIYDKHPELLKFLEEMPIQIKDEKREDISHKDLEKYNETLEEFLGHAQDIQKSELRINLQEALPGLYGPIGRELNNEMQS